MSYKAPRRMPPYLGVTGSSGIGVGVGGVVGGVGRGRGVEVGTARGGASREGVGTGEGAGRGGEDPPPHATNNNPTPTRRPASTKALSRIDPLQNPGARQKGRPRSWLYHSPPGTAPVKGTGGIPQGIPLYPPWGHKSYATAPGGWPPPGQRRSGYPLMGMMARRWMPSPIFCPLGPKASTWKVSLLPSKASRRARTRTTSPIRRGARWRTSRW
ncbi:hypothetical protein HRbin23_01156 [bacterium HR23]|nr:hypothetical protein HRbin23_01156 [bacterium HR23]